MVKGAKEAKVTNADKKSKEKKNANYKIIYFLRLHILV